MSHGAYRAPGAADDQPLLPATAGITNGVKLLVIAGLLCSIMQGTFVVMASTFGRVWPSADSAKVQLPPSKF